MSEDPAQPVVGVRIDEARQALSLVEETADEFTESLRHLSSTTVTDRQWFAFLDAWHPMPEESGVRARSRPGFGRSWWRCTGMTCGPAPGRKPRSGWCGR
ncbi:DUF932 domain-containing protein [Rhodococcus koreensis]